MTPDTTTAPCPACQAANLPGVKFCAQCGSPLATSATRSAAPATVPLAVSAAGPIVPVADAMARVRDALTRANATVTGGDGQSTLDYQLAYTERLLGPMQLHFAGTVATGPQGDTVTARMLPKSMAVQFGAFVVGCVVLGFIPRTLISNEMFVGAVAIALGLTAWITFSEAPKRVQRHIEGLIGPAATTAAAAPTAPAQAGAVTGAPAGDVFAQLERLAQMQATGLLSAEDVATKKAELLARI